MTRGALALGLVLGLGGGHLTAGPAAALQATPEVHGGDAVFVGRGVAIVWGVLRGADEATTGVVIWVASRDAEVQAVAVDLVDPLGGRRVEALTPSRIGKAREIRVARARFAEYPRLELRFAAGTTVLASGAAAFVVYYTGVPDATPEFPGEAALAEYLASALARARPSSR